jgi:hypothetical protein
MVVVRLHEGSDMAAPFTRDHCLVCSPQTKDHAWPKPAQPTKRATKHPKAPAVWENPRDVVPASDVSSLGLVFYQLITG